MCTKFRLPNGVERKLLTGLLSILSIFSNPKDAAVAIDYIMRKRGVDESCMNFPKSVGSSSKAVTDSEKTKFKYVHQVQFAKWRGERNIGGTSILTKRFYDAYDAAVAIDSIMREHGLDESCMNFPKSVGSSSKAATDSKMTNFKYVYRYGNRWGGVKWINGTSLNTKRFDDAKDAAVAIDKIMREHGLDESCMNFPKSAGSNLNAAGNENEENFKNVYLNKNGKWIGKKMIKGVKYCTTFSTMRKMQLLP